MNFSSSHDSDSTSIFGDEYPRYARSESNGISIERLNSLFHNGALTSEEHSQIVATLFPPPAKISRFAIASFVVSICSWILLLNYTSSGESYALLNGDGRAVAMTLLSPVALALAYIGMRETSLYENVKGKELAFTAICFSGFMFITLVVPYWLLIR